MANLPIYESKIIKDKYPRYIRILYYVLIPVWFKEASMCMNCSITVVEESRNSIPVLPSSL